MIGFGNSKVLAAAKKLGQPIKPEWLADLRGKYGDSVASPFGVLAGEWQAAVDARNPVRVLIAERHLSILLTALFISIQEAEGELP